MSFADCLKTAASLVWLAVKITLVMLLANSQAAQFVYQNF
jgi:hypothetical protein